MEVGYGGSVWRYGIWRWGMDVGYGGRVWM
jgi:hypothetical protein